MTKKTAKPARPPKLRPDANEIAFRVLQEATGEKPKTIPGQGPKNPDAVARGSKGGKKGGRVRAARLTEDELSAIGRKGGRPKRKRGA